MAPDKILRVADTVYLQHDEYRGNRKFPEIWAQQVWPKTQVFHFESIKDGSKILLNLAKEFRQAHPDQKFFWAGIFPQHARRGRLIEENLGGVTAKVLQRDARGRIGYRLEYPHCVKPSPGIVFGGWGLLDEHQMFACLEPRFPQAPLGNFEFGEDKTNPPSRAYLKLWEAFTRLGKSPQQGDVVIDLGASPGGWTWVLAELGAKVVSVDRSPLTKELMAHPNVEFRQESAFGFQPQNCEFDSIDWLLSDVICYPQKLLVFLQRWIESQKVKHILFTIKFQGDDDYTILQDFLKIPNVKIFHLSCNKNEVTLYYSQDCSFKPH